MDAAERRMTYRVTSEWVALKRQQPFPSIDFLNPKTFSVDWASCMLIRSLADTPCPSNEALEFEFIGRNFRKDAPALESGHRLTAIPPQSLLSLTTPLLPKLYDRQTAIIHNGIMPWSGSNALYFRSIAAPFADSAGVLRYALVAFSHKLTREVLRLDQTQTEFHEFRDGDWLPLVVLPERMVATA